MIGQSFEFEPDRTHGLGPWRHNAAGKRLDNHAVRSHVGDSRVAGHGFKLHTAERMRTADQQLFHSAVLVAE